MGRWSVFFGEIPRDDIAISQRKESTDKDLMANQLQLGTTIKQIFKSDDTAKSIINTNLLVEDRGHILRAFFDGDEYRYIQEEYMGLLRDGLEQNPTKMGGSKAMYIKNDKDDNGEVRYLTIVAFFRKMEEQNQFLKPRWEIENE